MQSQVLVGSKAFMDAFNSQAMDARKSLYVQAMTFEGDSAGEQLIELMLDSPAKDKRLLIDSFSKVVISDHFVFGPKYLKDKSFRQEIENTKALIRKAEDNGIQVKYTNPVGFLMSKYPLRNHKKMMIVDRRVSYIGGINFSDHNFDWHDMMIELDDESVGGSLSEDFLATWSGKNQNRKIQLENGALYFFNGSRSEMLYQDFFTHFETAQKEIKVISPYVSEPLLGELKKASRRGVEVTIISPSENNKGLFQDYLQQENSKGYFNLLHYPGMFHLKSVLIDGKKLIFGSSNYDLVSYHFEQEVVMVSEDKELVEKFIRMVSEPMTTESSQPEFSSYSSLKSKYTMKLLKGFCQFSSKTFLKPI